MCVIMQIPLDSIYNMTEEDYRGVIDMSHEVVDENINQASGKSHTRQPNSKELKLYNKLYKK